MRSFATALIAVSANAVKIAGIYEHDHHIVEPYTVTGDQTFTTTAIKAVPDGEATVTIRGQEFFNDEYSDESGMGSDDSGDRTTVVSFDSVSRHDHSDTYSESARGFKNSDYYSSQSGEAGGFYRDAHGDIQVYVDHSDDDRIGFIRDSDGVIVVTSEDDDSHATDDGVYGHRRRNDAFGPQRQVGKRYWSTKPFTFQDNDRETSYDSDDSDGSSYSHSHTSYSIHTDDSSADDQLKLREVTYEARIPTFSYQLQRNDSTARFARPAFASSVYTHADHGTGFRYDFGRSDAYGYDYRYGRNGVPFGRVGTYDYAGNAQKFAFFKGGI